MNSGPVNLTELLRDIEGSTHGGPRQTMLYDSLRRIVEDDPAGALAMIAQTPTSARSVLLTAISGVGRRALPAVLSHLTGDPARHAMDAAMILVIWSRRGLLSVHDREDLQSALSRLEDVPGCQPAARMITDVLDR